MNDATSTQREASPAIQQQVPEPFQFLSFPDIGNDCRSPPEALLANRADLIVAYYRKRPNLSIYLEGV
jgi:hypothetical protein